MLMEPKDKVILDVVSAATIVGTLTAWLPPIAAFLSIVWTILRLWEMVTGKTLSERRKKEKPVLVECNRRHVEE